MTAYFHLKIKISKMMCSHETQETEDQVEFQEQVEFDLAEGEEEEEEEDGKFDSGTIRHQSMTRLNSAAKRRRRPKCTTCGSGGSGGSMKRPSPPSFPQPSPKRLSLLPHPLSSVSAGGGWAAAAFGSKQPPYLLYRSLSEPIDSLGLGALNTQTADNLCFGQFLNSASPENPKIPAKNCESRPPIHPLHRSLSDPTVALEFQPPAVAPTPPRPSVAPTPPSSAEESPNTKRLKRMKERMRQMREWWDQILQEEDEHSTSYSQQHNNNSKEEEEEEGEESVWVEEKSGEWLVIHFKCPCNKGYEILLSGNNCYYKLM